jgi:hypothetical protein
LALRSPHFGAIITKSVTIRVALRRYGGIFKFVVRHVFIAPLPAECSLGAVEIEIVDLLGWMDEKSSVVAIACTTFAVYAAKAG